MGVATVLSLVVALIFYLSSTWAGVYEAVDVIGGTVYAFILSMIILFSAVPRIASSLSKKRMATDT
jgi:hypothetical protein